MNSKHEMVAAFFLVMALMGAVAFAGDGAIHVQNAIWGHDVLYGTTVAPNSFTNPPGHTVDKIYTFFMSGLQGQRSVSEAVPGDIDYNGGRWWVQMVVFTDEGLNFHDPDGDGFVNFELTDAEEVLHYRDLGYLEIYETSNYFSCPLNPSR